MQEELIKELRTQAAALYSAITDDCDAYPIDALVLYRMRYSNIRMLLATYDIEQGVDVKPLPLPPVVKPSPALINSLLDSVSTEYTQVTEDIVACVITTNNGFVVGKSTGSSATEARRQAMNNAKYYIECGETYARQVGYVA